MKKILDLDKNKKKLMTSMDKHRIYLENKARGMGIDINDTGGRPLESLVRGRMTRSEGTRLAARKMWASKGRTIDGRLIHVENELKRIDYKLNSISDQLGLGVDYE